MSNGSAGSRRKQPTSCSAKRECVRCDADRAFLRRQSRLRPAQQRGVITIVDLFAGCGGMTIGFEEAARRAGYGLAIPLAADSDPAAVAIYKANFPISGARVADVHQMFDGAVGEPLTAAENKIAGEIGDVDLLCGGPPCQGHSDLNNHTRRNDPKNSLYLRMARAAEVLLPNMVVIENVTAVQWDEGGVVSQTSEALVGCGYDVAGKVLDLRRIGVPQRRKRFVLIASRLLSVDPNKVLARLATSMPNHPDRSLRGRSVTSCRSMLVAYSIRQAELARTMPPASTCCSIGNCTTFQTSTDRNVTVMAITATYRCTADCIGPVLVRQLLRASARWDRVAMFILSVSER